MATETPELLGRVRAVIAELAEIHPLLPDLITGTDLCEAERYMCHCERVLHERARQYETSFTA